MRAYPIVACLNSVGFVTASTGRQASRSTSSHAVSRPRHPFMFGSLERALGSCHPPGPLTEERDGTAGSDYEVDREYNQLRRPAEASITDPPNSRSTFRCRLRGTLRDCGP